MRLLIPLALVVLMSPLGGCSVFMALDGQETPDLSVVALGASRGTVELEMGEPKTVVTAPAGGTVATYEYTVGNEPSMLRAFAHGTFDMLTWGLWEIAGVAIESAVDDKDYEVAVTYDMQGHVVSVSDRPTAWREEEQALIANAEE